jgi:hypothetical protein
MQPMIKQAFFSSLLGAMFVFAGCSQPPQPASAPASPSPTATVAEAPRSGDMLQAKEDLTKALTEAQNRNYRGALDLVNSAHKELTAVAANNPNLPDAVKTSLEQAGAGLEKLRPLLEQRDKTVDKMLTAAITNIDKLGTLVQGLTAVQGAAGAIGEALNKAAQPAATPKKQ